MSKYTKRELKRETLLFRLKKFSEIERSISNLLLNCLGPTFNPKVFSRALLVLDELALALRVWVTISLKRLTDISIGADR